MPKYIQSESSPIYFVEPGKYNVEIVNAVEKISSKGNEMIKLICQVILEDGTKGPEVHEHLTFVDVKACRRRIDDARKACGYSIVPGQEKEVKAEDFIGKTARVLLGEEEGTDNGHRFNKIERWMLPTESAPKPKTSAAEADEIPF